MLTYLTDLCLWKVCALASAALWCEFRDSPAPPSWATLDAPTGHFHRTRLHHTGVLICRDFCLGLRRGRGGRVRCTFMGRTNPPRLRLTASVPTCGIQRPFGTGRTISRVFAHHVPPIHQPSKSWGREIYQHL